MGTTAVSYKDKYFWMHDAVGEVFSAILLDELRKNPNIMIDLRNEIETILPHWVVGILVSFKDYLDNPDNIPIFIRAIDSSIKLTQGLERDLNILEYSVDRDTFFEEISAFKQLITEYDNFDKHAKIYSIHSKNWITA